MRGIKMLVVAACVLIASATKKNVLFFAVDGESPTLRPPFARPWPIGDGRWRILWNTGHHAA